MIILNDVKEARKLTGNRPEVGQILAIQVTYFKYTLADIDKFLNEKGFKLYSHMKQIYEKSQLQLNIDCGRSQNDKSIEMLWQRQITSHFNV